jgi:hypothetical protein
MLSSAGKKSWLSLKITSKFFYRHLLTLIKLGLLGYVLVAIGTPKSFLSLFFILMGSSFFDWLKMPSSTRTLLLRVMNRHLLTIGSSFFIFYAFTINAQYPGSWIGLSLLLFIPILFDRLKMKNPIPLEFRSHFSNPNDAFKFGTVSWMSNGAAPGSPAYEIFRHTTPKLFGKP